MASIRANLFQLLPFLAFSFCGAPTAHAQCLSWDRGFGPGPNVLTGPGTNLPNVQSFLVHDDGSGPALYVGGQFQAAGSATTRSIARWDGTQWSSVGGGTGQAGWPVFALCSFDDGSGSALYAGGSFTNMGGASVMDIARWNGSAWSAVGAPDAGAFPIYGGVAGLCTFDGGTGPALYAVGDFYRLGGVVVDGIARWDGASWSSVGGGLSSTPASNLRFGAVARVFDDGSGSKLYVGGLFNHVGNVNVHAIAAWDGTQWSDVGGGVIDANGGVQGYVTALRVFDDGQGPALYAGGFFGFAGGQPAVNVARWNGVGWSSVGAGLPSSDTFHDHVVQALEVFDDGSGPALYAAGPGAAGVMRWNGSAWTPLSTGATGAPPPFSSGGDAVRAFGVYDDGQGAGASLFAGGYFSQIGTIPSLGIAEWHGCSASPGYFCAGDGGEFNCPCNNNGLAGRGCENSGATGGARLAASGTTNPDTLAFHASAELPSSTTILLQGDQTMGFVLFGDGLRCIGGSLHRMYVKSASSGAVTMPAAGDPSVSARSAAVGDVLAPGAVRLYMAQYRDPIGSCTVPGGRFNSTNAVRIRW